MLAALLTRQACLDSLRRPALFALAAGLTVTASATAAALPPLDPQVQTTVVADGRYFGGSGPGGFHWTFRGWRQDRQEELTYHAMPLDGSAPTREVSLLPTGFLTLGT